MEAGWQGEDGWRAEQGKRLQEGDERPGQQRRQDERQRDAPQCRGARAAEDRRGILEIGRYAVECIRDQDEDVRKGIAGDREGDALDRIDVEQMLVGIEIEQRAIPLVEHAAIWRREYLPGDRPEEWRRHKRSGHEGPDHAAKRHVGPRYQPSERRCHRAGADRHAERDGERGEERRDEAGIADQLDEIRRRQRSGLVGDACTRQAKATAATPACRETDRARRAEASKRRSAAFAADPTDATRRSWRSILDDVAPHPLRSRNTRRICA